MKLEHLSILLPCQSLEDFSLQRGADEAEQLLSAWSALWHPALMKDTQSVPGWFPAEEPPEDLAGHLVMLPDCSAALLPDDWLVRAESAGAGVIRGLQHRDEFLAAALEQLEQLDSPPAGLDAELVADFLALGFCHLHVELLTRQLRYMSNLDEEAFRSEVLMAVDELFKGDSEATHERLQSAFDLLNESREYFYPVEAHLLDLTLVAPTTLGESLRSELAGDVPSNLLVSGEVIRQMARQEPATLKLLAEALDKNTAALIGGEFGERPLPMLMPEAIHSDLGQGLAAYQDHLGNRPTVFGRRRFGLSPVLPQILRRLGFVAALHCTLDDGRFPVGNQSRVQWEGIDGTVLEALAKVPIDISRADAFLGLPEKLGNSMDLDQVATVVLAHWPGQSSPWYRDLKRIAAYSPVMGTFSTITAYFDETGTSGQQVQYTADQYRSPYLTQAVAGGQADPVSRWVRYYARRAAVETLQTLDALAAFAACSFAAKVEWIEELVARIEDLLSSDSDPGEQLDRELQSRLEQAVGRFAESVSSPNGPGEKGCLVANPWSFSRRLCVETPESAVVDLPAMGFAWVGSGSGDVQPPEPLETKRRRWGKKQKGDPPLAEENILRNEFFEVVIDPHTGAIRSISDYYSRDARLAQQIALRMSQPGSDEPGHDRHYSIMAADEVTVTASGPVTGEIVSRGRLVDRQARRLAGFVQTTRVRRGSRVIELEIDLDIEQPPGPSPWHSYYAARFAWSNAVANVYRSVNLANCPTDAVQLEAPHFVDIRAGKTRTTLLCGGLPYHRRFGLRKLDTLLVVRGETARRFRLGIGIDVPHPVSAALDFIAPETVFFSGHPPPAGSGWLFHLDARNVVATHWEPLVSDGDNVFSGRRHDGPTGFRVRLLETDGRKVRLGLRSFRAVVSARKTSSGDTPPPELPVDGDQVTVEIGPHEWAEVEAHFIV